MPLKWRMALDCSQRTPGNNAPRTHVLWCGRGRGPVNWRRRRGRFLVFHSTFGILPCMWHCLWAKPGIYHGWRRIGVNHAILQWLDWRPWLPIPHVCIVIFIPLIKEMSTLWALAECWSASLSVFGLGRMVIHVDIRLDWSGCDTHIVIVWSVGLLGFVQRCASMLFFVKTLESLICWRTIALTVIVW